MKGTSIQERHKESARFVTGSKCRYIQFRLRMNILKIALSVYGNPFTAGKVLKALIRKKKAILGNFINPRLAKANGRYFWTVASAGWPSLAFDRFVSNEMNKVTPFQSSADQLQSMIFSITSRCPLQCEHCYEWNNLSAQEMLTYENLTTIMKKFQSYGITNIQFSGGEPLTRFNDLVRLIKSAEPGTELWILTSGFGLTPEKAEELKKAGLTGVIISLDHWDEASHNQFRKNDKSFYWVKEAARNTVQVDLVMAFSLCAGKEFVSEENLQKYLELAKDSGASFIRILEPREVGHYEGKKIELEKEQIKLLNDFYLKINSDRSGKDLPLIEYTGYHQRNSGCFGAGDRYLYVDSRGDIHACPFCQNPVGNALVEPLSESIAKLKEVGCHKF